MRYDSIAVFMVRDSVYNDDTGNYTETESELQRVAASASPTSTEDMQLVYGGLRQDSVTIQIRQHVGQPFDFIRLIRAGKSEKFNADTIRTLRHKQVFVCSER